MILAIDIGNTHTVIGVFRGAELTASFRLRSDRDRTVDEYALELLSLLEHSGIDRASIVQVVVACVVPALTRVFAKLAQKYLKQDALIVGPGIKTGMVVSVDDPRLVGADRVVNSAAAKELYGVPAVVVDFGTATTFDIVSAKGAYEGGLIAPGLVISANALFERAAMLSSIELRTPQRLIGKNTHDAMLAGIMFGYTGLVDGILERLLRELGTETKVIATGGLSAAIAHESKYIKEIVPDLTLQGLRLVALMNKTG